MSAPFSFGRGRGRGGSASPSPGFSFPPTDNPTTATWDFSCGHVIIKQEKIISNPFGGGMSAFLRSRSFEQKCPECLETDDSKQKSEQEVARTKAEEELARMKAKEEQQRQKAEARRTAAEEARKKAEEAAKVEQHDKQSLEVYKSQAVTIQSHIGNAGDNEVLRANLEKMLENCKLLWSNMVKESFSKGTENEQAESNSKLFYKSLVEKKEIVELMCSRAHILWEKHQAKTAPDDTNSMELMASCGSWVKTRDKLRDLAKEYDETVLSTLEEIENEAKAAWGEAMKLMKE